jgi:hypothetical protein
VRDAAEARSGFYGLAVEGVLRFLLDNVPPFSASGLADLAVQPLEVFSFSVRFFQHSTNLAGFFSRLRRSY